MTLLQDHFAAQAENRGDATAVVMAGERMTYGELATAANQLAHLLIQCGCRRGDRVCLLADKSPQTITAMLGALQAGCAYVPVDTASPAARAARIVRAADPAAVLVSAAGAPLHAQLLAARDLPRSIPIGALTAMPNAGLTERFAFGPDDRANQSVDAPAICCDPQDAAHILFTSGSTGEPKGVVISHANVNAFLDWALPYFGTAPDDRISGHPPLHFDLSTFDIYGTLRAGATLHLVPPSLLLPRQLAQFILDAELTQWFSVPSAMAYMAKLGAVPDTGFPSLKRVLWCGEVLPTPVLIHWMERIPQATFTNLYGPTETTIASSCYTLREIPADGTAGVPIGTACDGEELLVLDERLRQPETGAVGDIYIGGDGLSSGYWRDESKTSAAFIPDPRPGREGERLYRTGDLGVVDADGMAHFLGRTDSQIKSRGYRIELGEIETAVTALPEIAEAAVVGVPSEGFEGTAICCAFACAEGVEITVSWLRETLRRVLPSYMLPARWLPMDRLPKNANGKIDRSRLRELGSTPDRLAVRVD